MNGSLLLVQKCFERFFTPDFTLGKLGRWLSGGILLKHGSSVTFINQGDE
jgi:hypothetical protein